MVLAVAVDRKVLIDAAVGAPQLGAPQLVAQGVVQRWQIPKVVVVVGGALSAEAVSDLASVSGTVLADVCSTCGGCSDDFVSTLVSSSLKVLVTVSKILNEKGNILDILKKSLVFVICGHCEFAIHKVKFLSMY